MPSSHTKVLLADLTLVLMVVIWGSTFYMVKDILDAVDPIGVIFYRFILAAILLAAGLLFTKLPLWKNFHYGLLVGFTLWAIYVPQNIGLQYTTASNSGLITALYVAFMPLFARFFNIRISPIRILSCFVAMAGLWLLTGGFHLMNKGDLITLIAPVGVTFYVLFTDRYLRRGMHPLTLSFQQFLVCGLLSLVWMFFSEASFAITTTKALWVMGYLTLFATVITFVVYNFVQKITTPMKVALIFALEPVFAALFAYWFGGERFTGFQILGATLIVVAVMVSEANLEQFDSVRRLLVKLKLIKPGEILEEEGVT